MVPFTEQSFTLKLIKNLFHARTQEDRLLKKAQRRTRSRDGKLRKEVRFEFDKDDHKNINIEMQQKYEFEKRRSIIVPSKWKCKLFCVRHFWWLKYLDFTVFCQCFICCYNLHRKKTNQNRILRLWRQGSQKIDDELNLANLIKSMIDLKQLLRN